MSDVTVAPQGAAPPSAAPSAPTNEVPINQNPVHTPNPVGQQAPERPPSGNERRDAVQRAFDRADKPQSKVERPKPKEAPKAAEAKPGHNNPPEPTEKFDLKKRPQDQPQAPAARDRGEHGHFAPRAQDAQTGVPERAQDAKNAQNVQTSKDYPRLPPHAPYANPPARMAEHGRREWANTPESVRGEIHRVQNEFMKAYNHYKTDYDAFKPLKKYHQMAVSHGTTLEKAVANYVNMEEKLRANPIAGIDVIIRNLGLKTTDGRPAGLRDFCYDVLSRSEGEIQQTQLGNAQQAATHQIGALHQEIQGLKKELHQMHYAQQFNYTRAQIDQFAANHPRLDELGTIIEQELKLGFNLDQAYQRAELLRPAAHAVQTRAPPAQTRPVDRSIHGNPDVAPSNGASRRPQKASASPRDAVQNALNRMNGSF